MNEKDRDDLLYRVLRALRRQESDSKRYRLQQIGESLIGTYLELNRKDVDEMISNLDQK